jgi:cupin fold WbuC family metalloprotein
MMIELKRINDEIFVAKESIVSLGDEETSFLKSQAMHSQRYRARICVHKNNEDALHEMIIAISSQSYIHPHKHIGKSESFHIIEGSVDVVIFDDVGEITNIVKLGEPGSGRSYFYRLSESKFHTLIIHSNILVMHEVTNGPFDKEQTILASFAPTEGDESAVRNYIQYLNGEVAKFGRSGCGSKHT